MRAFVLTDKAFGRVAGRFVWLAMNTETPRGAAFLKQYPISAWPTFYIIDPKTETVALRWVGGGSVAQMLELLDNGARLLGGPTAKEKRKTGPSVEDLLRTAEKIYGEGNYKGSIPAYRKVLAAAPRGWSQYGRTVESLLFAYQMVGNDEDCARLAIEAWPRLDHTSSSANLAASGLYCALGLDKRFPVRSEWVRSFERKSREVLDDKTLTLAVDDRSGVYGSLVDARDEAGDDAGVKRVATEWVNYLDAEAAKAKTPEERTVFDSHRLSAYLVLGQPEKAIPFLEQSEKDFPDDYNPPSRLAIAYNAMKEYHKALAASDRAMELAYGPRKLGFYRTRSDIYVGMGDMANARKTLEEAIGYAEALPEGQRSERTIAYFKKKLEGLEK